MQGYAAVWGVKGYTGYDGKNMRCAEVRQARVRARKTTLKGEEGLERGALERGALQRFGRLAVHSRRDRTPTAFLLCTHGLISTYRF